MKRLVLGLTSILLLIGLNGCSNSETRKVKTLNDLPLKDNLSYISDLNIVLGFSENDNEKFLNVKSVKKMYSNGTKGYMIKIWKTATFLDFSKVNEFKIESKIVPLMINAKTAVANDMNNYLKAYNDLSIPLHIKLNHKSLPINLDRNGLITISKKNIITFSRTVNSLHNIKSHDLVIKLFGENANRYISKKSENKDIIYGAKISLSEYGLQIKNKTSNDRKYIYKLGKKNLGKDNLIDITIGATGSSNIIPFEITSFKFEKASNERFYLINYNYVSESYIKAMYQILKSDETTSNKTLKIKMYAYKEDYMNKKPLLFQEIKNAYNTILKYRKIVDLI